MRVRVGALRVRPAGTSCGCVLRVCPAGVPCACVLRVRHAACASCGRAPPRKKCAQIAHDLPRTTLGSGIPRSSRYGLPWTRVFCIPRGALPESRPQRGSPVRSKALAVLVDLNLRHRAAPLADASVSFRDPFEAYHTRGPPDAHLGTREAHIAFPECLPTAPRARRLPRAMWRYLARGTRRRARSKEPHRNGKHE